jgi:DNA-directed RNA polymerase specialized sigma24 family protein
MGIMRIHGNQHSNETHKQATCEEFCRAFQNDLASLYRLALLLTVNHAKAESILVAGIEECVSDNFAFKEWARSWAKRIIIANAIRLIAPLPWDTDNPYAEGGDIDAHLLGVARLSAFDRFVFVMSVLERIPDQECAALLGCGTPAIVKARARALKTIGQVESSPQVTVISAPALASLGAA